MADAAPTDNATSKRACRNVVRASLRLDNLQEDLLVLLLSFLPAKSLLCTAVACKSVRRYSFFPDLWKPLLRKDIAMFGVSSFFKDIFNRVDIRTAGDKSFYALYRKLFCCMRARVAEWQQARERTWAQFKHNPNYAESATQMFKHKCNWDVFCSLSPFDQRHSPNGSLVETVGGAMHNCVWEKADPEGIWRPLVSETNLRVPSVLLHVALDILLCHEQDPFDTKQGSVTTPITIPTPIDDTADADQQLHSLDPGFAAADPGFAAADPDGSVAGHSIQSQSTAQPSNAPLGESRSRSGSGSSLSAVTLKLKRHDYLFLRHFFTIDGQLQLDRDEVTALEAAVGGTYRLVPAAGMGSVGVSFWTPLAELEEGAWMKDCMATKGGCPSRTTQYATTQHATQYAWPDT
jgi:hypothetical protein